MNLFTASPKSRVSSICIGEITDSERVVVGPDGMEKISSGFQHWHWGQAADTGKNPPEVAFALLSACL